MGALNRRDRRLIVTTSRTRRSADFAAFAEDRDHPCGPEPGQRQSPVVTSSGNGPIHTSKATKAALAARAHWPGFEGLSKRAPELKDIETVRRDFKVHYLAHQTFTGTEDPDRTNHNAVGVMNLERQPNPLASQRPSA